MGRGRPIFNALFLTLFCCSVSAVELNDASYDGEVLRLPYLEFNDLKYQLSFIPADASVLISQDCPVLCLKLTDAAASDIEAIRDSASFDGTTLSVP